MSIKYDSRDLICNMIELEKVGCEFYSVQAEQSESFTVKKLFAQLAEEEKRHWSIYEQLKKQIHEDPEADSDDSYDDYLKHIIDENFDFTNVDKETENTKNVLDIAIKLEKQSLAFIDNLASSVKSIKSDVLDKIKNEELGHLKLLQEIKTQFK